MAPALTVSREGSILAQGILTGVKPDRTNPLVSIHNNSSKSEGCLLCSYLRGLSLNTVLWLPATELAPLLLLPPSLSSWE